MGRETDLDVPRHGEESNFPENERKTGKAPLVQHKDKKRNKIGKGMKSLSQGRG